ncbi:MAG: hypothetical protein KF861_12065 [Planctomycetaceae bacterium]|nr:hypothetical protein [Planctomycetaceae bacterium]
MKRFRIVFASLSLCALGCADSATQTADNTAPSETITVNKPIEPVTTPAEPTSPEATPTEPTKVETESAAQRVRRELDETADAVADWSAETRQHLVDKAEDGLAKLDAAMAKLDTQAESLKSDAKVRWEESRHQFEQQRQEFAQQLEELKSSSGDAWKELAEGIAKAYADLKESAKKAATAFERE